jgi:flavin-dependent dehydrogenase
MDGLEIYRRDRNVVFAFPTNDGLIAIFIGWPIAEFGGVRQDVAAGFMKVLEKIPMLDERIREGTHEERFYGTADVPNFFRKPYGSGWALVGDAGYHKDPYMALGISDALRDAELVASAIDRGLCGGQHLLDALADYEQQRNAAAMQLYHQNAQLARFGPVPDDEFALRAVLQGNEEMTNKFYMARQGMIPMEEFFNPDNLRRLRAGVGDSFTRRGTTEKELATF